MRSQRQYLQDIVQAMEAAESFVEDVQFEDLEGNLEKQYALQRAFEIIGEATKQLDASLRERYPDVPWADMAGMRDVLIHQYFAVHLETVWNTIHERFPPIQTQIRRILGSVRKVSGQGERAVAACSGRRVKAKLHGAPAE